MDEGTDPSGPGPKKKKKKKEKFGFPQPREKNNNNNNKFCLYFFIFGIVLPSPKNLDPFPFNQPGPISNCSTQKLNKDKTLK